ncbi:beta-(1-6) glucans synthase [Bradyrhizobium sp. BRP22]|uniref:glycoside hydrolase family 17 protein n=1 Tax=Bradyrhizobium sp. BRP22 TaxID=2793821 RepID=UPI001CD69890|nr:beta-(1-6) glucans synthase [Bradyrhizobium sp. BRP22]MCA1456910.1 beta-(1-6) glucans synthase [Bradyrhizobium sp. BRP22]
MKVPFGFAAPLLLFLLSMSIIVAAWCWLATPVASGHAPVDPVRKLDCVSYAPFRGHQTPWNSSVVISADQIAQDFADLARITNCIRIYSVENGLDKVPELASKVGLKVILGVWIGRDRLKNASLIETAVLLANQFTDVVTAVIVGNEVLLRGELPEAGLREAIRSAKGRVSVPVSYADSWDFWLRYPELAHDVDFVTIHVLPYWEDVPPRAEDAPQHVIDARNKIALAFPGKEIFIGEAGWPSRGRMRDGALPSRINQARFTFDLLDKANRENVRINLFEAYDEPWKRQWEGTVGAHWGWLDGESRQLKYSSGATVSNYPHWKLQLGAGLGFGIAVFVTALLARWRSAAPSALPRWLAVAASATASGILLGVSVENALYESYGFAGLVRQGSLLMTAMFLPLLCANALMSGRALPAFVELIGPRETRTRSLPALLLGAVLLVTALVAVEVALGLMFDPRSRDFPFAGLTMAVVPIWTVALLNRRKLPVCATSEAVFASLFAAAAFYILLHEGVQNWQSLWTSTTLFLLGAALWRSRSAVLSGDIGHARAVELRTQV